LKPASDHPTPTLYDLVDYPARPYAATHPDRLATLGRLYGVPTADPRRCRVLELGCSDGGNLLAMAVALPESTFLGIDAASTAIEEGSRVGKAAGIGNVALRYADLLELGPELGQFDFIVTHGVYSWVPEPVRQKLLELCKVCLAPSGVAYVSYNAKPGGFLRRPARDLMRFHVRAETDPAVAIEEALNALSRTAGAVPEGHVYRQALEQELAQLARAGTSFVFHDVLAPENEPFYFEEFNQRAEAAGLKYLSDARFMETYEGAELNGLTVHLPEAAKGQLLRAEQYLDFIKCRTFRQSLLVHPQHTLERAPDVERLRGLSVTAQVQAAPAPDGIGDSPVERFVLPGGNRITTDDPIAKATLSALGEAWPRSLAFDELCRRIYAGASVPPALEQGLAKLLLRFYAADAVDLRTAPTHFVSAPGERPRASPLARQQALTESIVTNTRHARVELEDALRPLFMLLDGSRTQAELASATSWPLAKVESGLAHLCKLGLLLA
jgi:SAM-dependent methyltransferase/methyltransferase-like protein